MLKRLITTICLLLAVSACQPTAPAATAPTLIPFPTTTPGRIIRGALPTVSALQLSGNLSNPATAVALANRPTATPDYATCPPAASTTPTLSNAPANAREIADEIVLFLSAGGTPIALQDALRDDWQILGESGFVRADADLTREGQPEILVSYTAPNDGGHLLILGCANSRYTLHTDLAFAGDPPEIVQLGDMNFDLLPEILLTSRECDPENVDDCAYRTQLLTWQTESARFTSLLDAVLTSPEKPTISDVDTDRIVEIVLRQTSTGTSETGPLRTGVTIYDWNGVNYTQSITQLDPPQFRIQVIQQADRNMLRSDIEAAIPQYQLALSDTALRNWFNDDEAVLRSYALYRLLTAYAFTESSEFLLTYQTIIQTYPDPNTAPVYTALSLAFWNAFQVSNNLRSACQAVQDIITIRPEAVDLLNRYGSRGPAYTANQLCSF